MNEDDKQAIKANLRAARPSPRKAREVSEEERARIGLNGYGADATPVPAPTLEALMGVPPFAIMTMAQAVARKRPGWRIENILRAESVYTMTGTPGSGKTTLVALIAACVSAGQPFAGQGTLQGNVLMLCADDFGGAADRAAVLDMQPAYRGSLMRTLVSRHSVDITTEDALQALANIAAAAAQPGGLALISVDTILHYAPGGMDNENDNVGMSRYLQVARKLTQLPGSPTVLIQCHPRKGAPDDVEHLVPRGGSAALGASDGNIAVWLDGDLLSMHHSAKMRGSFDELHFRLDKQVLLPDLRDEAGLPVYAPMVTPMSIGDVVATRRADIAGQEAVLAHLEELQPDQWARAPDIALSQGIPPRTVQYHLKVLLEDKRVIREGGSKNSRYRAKPARGKK